MADKGLPFSTTVKTQKQSRPSSFADWLQEVTKDSGKSFRKTTSWLASPLPAAYFNFECQKPNITLVFLTTFPL